MKKLKCWTKGISTNLKETWRNDLDRRWAGIQKVKENQRFWAMKDGQITWGDFKDKKDAKKMLKDFMKKHDRC